MPERPFLTAAWNDLLLLNFEVPPEALSHLAPPGTELDTHAGRAYLSVVGFRFCDVRVLGIRPLGHTLFPEINLRCYVRRVVDHEVRRGVVFIREIVPRRAVSLIANRLYHENYVTRRMRSEVRLAGARLAVGDSVEYAWRSRAATERADRARIWARDTWRWNRLAARVAAPLAIPPAGSLESYFVEHYWGYARSRDGGTHEYRVEHAPWHVAPAGDIEWDCDVGASYGESFVRYLSSAPTSALIALGSPVRVFRGRRLP